MRVHDALTTQKRHADVENFVVQTLAFCGLRPRV
jgi:hypothetical protein